MPATGECDHRNAGQYLHLLVRSASVPFLLSTDGETFFQVSQNERRMLTAPSKFLSGRCINGIPCKASVEVSMNPIAQQDTQVISQLTQTLGNRGFPDNNLAGFGGLAVSAAGWMQLPAASSFALVPSFTEAGQPLDGRLRTMIIFTVKSTSAALQVLDSFNNTALFISPGANIALPVSDTLTVKNATAGVIEFSTLEIFPARGQ